jgi:DNA-binding NarL/FixJ family response regulator
MGGDVERVRVAAVNDYEIVVAGLAAMLAEHSDRLVVMDAIIAGEPLKAPVDVALYDTFGRVGLAADALRMLAAMDDVGRVAVFTNDLDPRLIAEAEEAGARGFISKQLSGDAIADAVVRIAQGELVIATHAAPVAERPHLDWPGRTQGLTERESEVVVLAAEGLSNREIAAALFLSPHTVKGYVSQALRKLGLRNRVEAAAFVNAGGAFARTARKLDLPES